MVKNPPANVGDARDPGPIPGSGRFLVKGMATHSSVLKSRDITLPTKVRLVKAVVFPAVMYGYQSWTIKKAAAAAAKSVQSCLTLCDPVNGSPPGSPIPGILQARTLEWVAVSFSSA